MRTTDEQGLQEFARVRRVDFRQVIILTAVGRILSDGLHCPPPVGLELMKASTSADLYRTAAPIFRYFGPLRRSRQRRTAATLTDRYLASWRSFANWGNWLLSMTTISLHPVFMCAFVEPTMGASP